VCVYTRSDNIYAGLPLSTSSTDSKYTDADSEIKGALGSAVAFATVEVLLQLVGLTIISHSHNLTVAILHGVGFLLTTWYVFENWNYKSFWA